jgi:hypothetical protein
VPLDEEVSRLCRRSAELGAMSRSLFDQSAAIRSMSEPVLEKSSFLLRHLLVPVEPAYKNCPSQGMALEPGIQLLRRQTGR